MHLHCALWAEFLTAEAADTRLAVDTGFFVHHGNGLGRTYIPALAAPHALHLFHHRPLGQRPVHHRPLHPAEQALAVSLEQVAVAGGDALKVRDGKGGGVAFHCQLRLRSGDEPPFQCRLQGGHLFPLQADEPGAHQVRLVGALRRYQRLHMPGCASGGPVPLHALHRVHNGEAGLEILVQIHNHPGKIPGIGIPKVAFRLHGAGNGPKHVFCPAGHGHHPVGLELAQVDDRVRITQPCGILELAAHLSLREMCLPLPEILVEPPTRLFRRPHAGGGVHPVHVGGVIQPSGAVPHHHVRPPRPQQFHQGAEKPGVGGNCLFRLGKGYQIHFDGNFHSRAHPIQPAQWLYHPLQCRHDLCLSIIRTGNNYNVRLHNFSPLTEKGCRSCGSLFQF